MGRQYRALKAPAADQAAPLGNKTQSTTPLKSRADYRSRRYELQSAARSILLAEGNRQGLHHPQNVHRTCKCLRHIHGGEVGVLRSKEHDSSFYGGLMACGSVWACPVCAAKVQERRRTEISQFFDYAYRKGGGSKVVMVTLTFPHQAWHKLGDLLAQQTDALRRLRRGGPWNRIRDQAGYHGLIRALELTHGEHGWHPHTHELWLVSADCDADWLRSAVQRRWARSCERAGLLDPSDEAAQEAFADHAVQVRDEAHEGDYLAKQDDAENLGHWGADQEISKASSKQGRSKGRHPFELLADWQDGDQRAALLFLEYCQEMQGKRQIFWSHGLKAEVGVKDESDQELAEKQEDYADCLAMLSPVQWREVLKADARAELLAIAESDGDVGIARWFEGRGLTPPDLNRPRAAAA